MISRRVVVTGLGVISSIGIGKNEFWANLISGKSGISDVSLFDVSRYDNKRGGEVKNFIPAAFIQRKHLRNMARASQFAVAASTIALQDAQLDVDDLNGEKAGVIFGTTMGEGGMIEEIDKHWTALGENDVWGITVSKYPSNAIANNVSRVLGLKGISYMIPTACSAGNYSIGFGYDLIRNGLITHAIVGGADPFSRIGFTGFGRLYAMSPDMCRPFDKHRKGMMIGEGSGVLVLENYDFAVKRNAKIYAEILGYGLSCDAGHMTAPRVRGIVKAMRKAIVNSRIKVKDIDYVCAHGTGTLPNDKSECQALKTIFGTRHKDVPVNSIKSMLGHTMGAASALETISCCMSIKEDVVPPTINYETPDPDCDIDCVPNKARQTRVDVALNNSLAFGGNNACLALGKV